jgi:hypothetical protein
VAAFVVLEVVVLPEQPKVVVRSDTHNEIPPILQFCVCTVDPFSSLSCQFLLQEPRILHLNLDILHILFRRHPWSIVSPQPNSSFSFLLGVRLLLQCLNPAIHQSRFLYPALLPKNSLSLMRTPLPMPHQTVLRLKPFRTLDAIEFSQTRQILRCFRVLMVCEMFR